MVFIIFCGMGWFFYQQVKPVHIYENIDQPFKVLNENKVVYKGEPLIFEIHYIKNNEYPTDSTKTIECDDGNLVTIVGDSKVLPKGENTLISKNTIIPQKTSNGMCRLVFINVYKVGPLREEVLRLETEYFEVKTKDLNSRSE